MAKNLTAAQQAAMVVMSLDEEQAAALLKRMNETALAKLRAAAESLDVSTIGDAEKRAALVGFFQRRRKGTFFLGAPDQRFRQILIKARGEERARRILEGESEKAQAEGEAASPVEYLENAPDSQIAALLEKESPRCGAVLLSAVSSGKAGRILNRLEQDRREAIVGRLIVNEQVPPEIAQEVLQGFVERLREFGADSGAVSEEKRVKELAGMINTLDRESQARVLSRIQEENPELADQVERKMFSFEDLVRVGPKSMQDLLRKVEEAQIALALKGCSEELHKHFFACVSQRARDRIEEEMQMVGRVPLSQVNEAREEIMKIARKMYRNGEMAVEIGEEQYVE